MGIAQDGKGATGQKSGYKDRFWIPRFWDGMCLGGWIPLLVRNRFAVSPIRMAMALLILCLGFLNLVLWLLQTALYGRKIERTKIEDDPIFVIGHWRSGTTLLHELLVLDRRHTFADTYACFAPNHFLVSGWLIKPWLKLLLPSRRPMDRLRCYRVLRSAGFSRRASTGTRRAGGGPSWGQGGSGLSSS